MSVPGSTFRSAAWILVCVAGCSAKIADDRFACVTVADCPAGFACRAGSGGALRCFAASGMDGGGVDGGPGVDGAPGVDAGHPCPSCDDGMACTRDVCDTVTGMCMHSMESDGTTCGSNMQCMGGDCSCLGHFDDCDGMPGCEANLNSDALHCGSCTMPCAAGSSCIMGTCGTCGSAADCDDGLACTLDGCSTAGMCTVTILNPNCVIAGVCYASRAVNPTNPCQECDASMSTGAWSARIGGHCDDGSTAGCGGCSGGACLTASTCDDGLACTNDVCNDGTGTCTQPLAAGNCLIAGACYAAGAAHATNPCEVCSPGISTTAFSAGVAPCTDGNPSSCDDQCVGTSCHGVVPVCDDLDDCTTDFVDCSTMDHCGHGNAADGTDCSTNPGSPSRAHCCGGNCLDFGNCCTVGSCGFGGVCAAACNSFSCCFSCGGPGSSCGA